MSNKFFDFAYMYADIVYVEKNFSLLWIASPSSNRSAQERTSADNMERALRRDLYYV